MWKRLTALLFIFILGGQVWAGVCGCFENGPKPMVCCKRDKAKKDAVTRNKCCDGPCGLPSNDRQPRTAAEANLNFRPAQFVAERTFEFRPRLIAYALPTVVRQRFAIPSRLSRPPNLYLHNHSFLI